VFALRVEVTDKLTEQQRKCVQKMSDARLIAKLAQVDVSSENLEGMDRQALLEAWAVVVASGNDEPLVKEGATSVNESVLEGERF
jgi:hypothetical protein